MGDQPKQSKSRRVFWVSGIIVIMVMIFILWAIPNIIFHNLLMKRINFTRTQIESLENLLTKYYTDIGCYPSTTVGLKALVERPASPEGAKWMGPYTATLVAKDTWGRDLYYQCPGTHNLDSYDLWSYGADGVKGGKGVEADIGNW